MEESVKSFDNWMNAIEEDSISGSAANRYAKKSGLDVRKYKGKKSELINGGPIESTMIDIVADLEKITGFEFEVTGGNDSFHQTRLKEKGKFSHHTTSSMSGCLTDW